MSNSTPLVSCLMPTHNRRAFISRAVGLFLAQDYTHDELLVVDDGSDPVGDLLPADPRIRYHRLPGRVTLGEKRNLAAERASGEILVHWDDDDWMAPWRLRYQVRELLDSGADACGLARCFFHDPASDRAWEYRYTGTHPWVAGGTLCYTRSFWDTHRFGALGVGEDNDFVWRHRPRLLRLPDSRFYVATVHPGNTSRKQTSGSNWAPIRPEELPSRLAASLTLPPAAGGVTPAPSFFPRDDHAFYRQLMHADSIPAGPPAPSRPIRHFPLRRSMPPARSPGVGRGRVVVRRIGL